MKKHAAAVLIPLMLLPNFAFLVPVVAASLGVSPNPVAGQPLPPGTVSYLNTWNSTSVLTCPTSKVVSQPLLSASSWKASIQIPSMLFEGKPEGANLTQSFAISNNGTFTVSDGSGNSYSIGPPTGLPAGTTFTSLRTNSTTAIVTFLDLSSNSISSNVTEVYSVNKQFCYPSGLRIDVIGNTNWGLSLTGEISLPFKSSPINITSTRAYFGMSHGIELGIDWSDSLQSNPIFNRSGNSLTYPVQSQYSIDPVTGGGGGSAARQLV